MRLRRAFDCMLAGTGLVLAAVPLALSALAVKVSSAGPVIFRQSRIGRGGRPFDLYKLRTMSTSGTSGPQFTAAGDARVTGVGRILRRCKLDELPQLWNVLKGDMSIVGPRPEVPRFVDRYTDAQRAILDATPGLAGYATVVYRDEAALLRGYSDAEDAYVRHLMPLKIAADLEYERSRTLGSDVRLIVEIGLLVLGRRAGVLRVFRAPRSVAHL